MPYIRRLIFFLMGVLVSALVVDVVNRMPLFNDGSQRLHQPNDMLTLILLLFFVGIGLVGGHMEQQDDNTNRWHGLCWFWACGGIGVIVGMIYLNAPPTSGQLDITIAKLSAGLIGFVIFAGGAYLYNSARSSPQT